MNISKTTLTGIAGFIVIIAARFGFQVSEDVIVPILGVIVLLIGKFSQDQQGEAPTPTAFVGNFVGSFGASSLLFILPAIINEVGEYVIKKDGAVKGWKTAAGNLIKAFAPVATAIANGNESSFRKSLRGARDTINNYLGEAA